MRKRRLGRRRGGGYGDLCLAYSEGNWDVCILYYYTLGVYIQVRMN